MPREVFWILVAIVSVAVVIVPLLGGVMLLLTSRLIGIEKITYLRCWLAYLCAYVAATLVCLGLMLLLVPASNAPGGIIAWTSLPLPQFLFLFAVALAIHMVVVPLMLRTTYVRAVLAHGLAMLLYSTVIGIVAVIVLVPLVSNARESARQSVSRNNLRQIVRGFFEGYLEKHDRFPSPANQDQNGKPLLSWRVHLLPHVGYSYLYKEFHIDEPWDSPNNLALIKEMPDVFNAPGSYPIEEGKTRYLLPVGEQTVFPIPDQSHVGHGLDVAVTSTMGRIGSGAVTDGYIYTIVVVEVAPENAVIWTKPDDWEFDPQAPLKGLVGHKQNGFVAAMADGSTHWFSEDIDKETARWLFERNDDHKIDYSIFLQGR